MPLIDTPSKETSEQRLVREARARLSELRQATLLTYGNLMNYWHNNGAGVTPVQFEKSFGGDAKDLKYIMGSMKRMLLRMDPTLKAQLNEMVPKRNKKAAK